MFGTVVLLKVPLLAIFYIAHTEKGSVVISPVLSPAIVPSIFTRSPVAEDESAPEHDITTTIFHCRDGVN